MKILNLYAGIGGNRKLWGDEHEVTAVENNPEIAKIYQDFFPNDKVIVVDAHQFLLKHFEEYDFIWSSPPCQSHSQVRFIATFDKKTKKIRQKPIYPDMNLYQEILLLQHYFKGKFVVENVVGFYEPLIKPKNIARHYFWTNFNLVNIKTKSREHYGTIEKLEKRKNINLNKYNIQNKRQILRNCVEPETGLHILKCAIKQTQQTL